jgi:hypothetical protein
MSIGAIAAKGLRYRLDFWQGTGAFRNLAFQKQCEPGSDAARPNVQWRAGRNKTSPMHAADRLQLRSRLYCPLRHINDIDVIYA